MLLHLKNIFKKLYINIKNKKMIKTNDFIVLAKNFCFPTNKNVKPIKNGLHDIVEINFEIAVNKAKKDLNHVKLIVEECQAFNTLFECHFSLLETNLQKQTNKKIYNLCVEKHTELMKTYNVVKKVGYLLETLASRLAEKIKILNTYEKNNKDNIIANIINGPNLIRLKNLNIKINNELNLLDMLHPYMDLVKEFKNWQHSENFILNEKKLENDGQKQTNEKMLE